MTRAILVECAVVGLVQRSSLGSLAHAGVKKLPHGRHRAQPGQREFEVAGLAFPQSADDGVGRHCRGAGQPRVLIHHHGRAFGRVGKPKFFQPQHDVLPDVGDAFFGQQCLRQVQGAGCGDVGGGDLQLGCRLGIANVARVAFVRINEHHQPAGCRLLVEQLLQQPIFWP